MRSFLKKATWRRRLTNLVNITWSVSYHGVKIKVPIIRGMGLSNLSITEKWMIALLDHLLKNRKGTFVDVGVNLGQTLMKLKCIDPFIKYIGFEPNPICVYYVRELIRENELVNYTILPVGLSNKNGIAELSFFSTGEVESIASIINDFRPTHQIYHKQFVPVFCFDDVTAQLDLKDLSIVKIDVEGAELEVLQGMVDTIEVFRPIILLEVLPVYSSKNVMRKNRQEKVEKIIAELNYTILRVKKASHNTYGGLQAIEKVGIHSDLNQCDYVLVPNELKEEILGL